MFPHCGAKLVVIDEFLLKTEKIAKKTNKKSSHSEEVINAPASTGRKKRRSAGARGQPRA